MQTLKLSHVSKIYGQDSNRVVALDDVSFEAKQGELTLILGPSGSGKSTLLTIIGGLQSPTSGRVLVNDQVIDVQKQQDSDAFRLNQVGFVLQSYSLVPFLTVQQQFDLVDHVKKSGNLAPAQFQHYLAVLGIDDLLNKYPSALSGGQAQRVAIARALYADPDFILADEPTAALDSDRVQKVGALFRQIAVEQQKAVVVVTHDLRLKQYADHIYTIEDGHIQQEK
ncbi:ABC transporter ATP-binding protein [Leuconostoc lactis]